MVHPTIMVSRFQGSTRTTVQGIIIKNCRSSVSSTKDTVTLSPGETVNFGEQINPTPITETSRTITKVYQDGGTHQFDAMWISSLCDSTAKGKPDIELVDMTSRFRTIDDITEVTTKPIIFDGDTGGLTEHFVYTVRSLEKMGVSAVIIEDKKGLKKNSLFGTEVKQTQDSIE